MIDELEEAVEIERSNHFSINFFNKDRKEEVDQAEKIARLKLRAAEALNFAHEKSYSISDYLYSPSYEDLPYGSSGSMDRITDLMDEYEFVRES